MSFSPNRLYTPGNKDCDYFLLIIVFPENGFRHIYEYVNMSNTMIGKQRYKKTKKCHQYSRNVTYHRVKKKRGEKIGHTLVWVGVWSLKVMA